MYVCRFISHIQYRIKLHIRQLSEKVGLWDRNGDYPDHLSGGEQQRVAIACAMAAKPE